MLVDPNHRWYYTGSWPFSVPGVLWEQIKSVFPDFNGPGWYQKYKILVQQCPEERKGQPTFQVLKYDKDPRPMLLEAANLPTK